MRGSSQPFTCFSSTSRRSLRLLITVYVMFKRENSIWRGLKTPSCSGYHSYKGRWFSHSLCSIEYENHRPLYEWYPEQLGVFKPRQIEFSRLNMTYTVMSKRKLQIGRTSCRERV